MEQKKEVETAAPEQGALSFFSLFNTEDLREIRKQLDTIVADVRRAYNYFLYPVRREDLKNATEELKGALYRLEGLLKEVDKHTKGESMKTDRDLEIYHFTTNILKGINIDEIKKELKTEKERTLFMTYLFFQLFRELFPTNLYFVSFNMKRIGKATLITERDTRRKHIISIRW